MAGHGHIPKFDGPNAGNFTETFDIARSGGRGGSREPPQASKPEETTNNPPPTRRLPQRGRPAAAGATAPARRPARTNPKPVPVSDAGDSHIPTFGTWNVDGDQNYTGIFQAASNAKKGEAGGPTLESASGGKGSGGSGDLYKPHHSKKRSSSWCCFGVTSAY
ncbi:hypothetical protein M758_11G053100 [Ceratodon purpureus]|nr:hypothetical protein M758_11G053100 [Ceratodon purpureus]